jgi:AcrR family transcriptional regulator
MSPAPPRRAPGRPPGSSVVREEILAAARGEFTARGYDGASVRGIARSAGVDAALVHHYFGSKEGVFVAALELPIVPATIVPGLLAPGLDGLGERVARFFLSIWSDPAGRGPLLGLLRSASSSERAAAMLREFVSRTLLGRLAEALDLPDRELRVSLAASQLVGMAMLRWVVGLEPLARATDDELVALLAPVLQAYLAP